MSEPNQEQGLRSENFLDHESAIAYLDCGRTKFYQIRKRHQIAHYRHGGELYFKREDLDVYLASCKATLPTK